MKTPHLPTFATSSPLGSAVALEMAARARLAPLWRSKWPPEPDRLRWGARNGRSNSLGSARALEIDRPGCSKTMHLPTFPTSLERSKWPVEPAGTTKALEMAARTRLALTGRLIWLGLAAIKHRACRRFRLRACLATLGRLTLALEEPARLRWA